MKTLILAGVSAAALLAAGSAFAQSNTTQGSATASSSIDQTGNSNNAFVDQINHSAGSSVVIQGYADAVNEGGVVAQGNLANVTQDGTTGAKARVLQGNMSKPTQYNDPSSARYILSNSWGLKSNDGVAFQTARTAGLGGGDSWFGCGFSDTNGCSYLGNFGGDAAALADATKYGNSATIRQSGLNPDAVSYQYGNGNTSSITQHGSAGGSSLGMGSVTGNNAGSIASLETVAYNADHLDAASTAAGAMGGAAVVQDHALADYASVDQVNASNGALTVQFFATSSTAGITQAGSNGKALIAQRYGNNNAAGIVQESGSTFAVAYEDQNGADHSSASTDQSGGNQNAATFQSASNDSSTIIQSGGGSSSSLGNSAQVAQTASNDWSFVSQNGQGNTAVVNQVTGGALHFSH